MNALTTKSARASLGAVAVAALVALGFLLVPAGAASADDGDVTWTVRTASNNFGAERTGFSYAVNPGTQIDDAIVIANHGTQPLELSVYAADGYTTEDGNFDLLVAGEESLTIGAWITGATIPVTVAPGETAEFPFALDVPENATPGDYAGGIVTSLAQPDGADGISVDRRLGIKITLRVGGELAPSLAVDNVHVDWAGGLNPFTGGDATLSYTIQNTGNSTLSALQDATITGPFGWLPTPAGEIAAPPSLLPGESWDVSVAVPKVAAAVWLTATATVTPVVIDASGSTMPLTPVSASGNGWAVPWSLVVTILVLAAIVVAAVIIIRRRRATQKVRQDERVRDAVELALRDAAAPVTPQPIAE